MNIVTIFLIQVFRHLSVPSIVQGIADVESINKHYSDFITRNLLFFHHLKNFIAALLKNLNVKGLFIVIYFIISIFFNFLCIVLFLDFKDQVFSSLYEEKERYVKDFFSYNCINHGISVLRIFSFFFFELSLGRKEHNNSDFLQKEISKRQEVSKRSLFLKTFRRIAENKRQLRNTKGESYYEGTS